MKSESKIKLFCQLCLPSSFRSFLSILDSPGKPSSQSPLLIRVIITIKQLQNKQEQQKIRGSPYTFLHFFLQYGYKSCTTMTCVYHYISRWVVQQRLLAILHHQYFLESQRKLSLEISGGASQTTYTHSAPTSNIHLCLSSLYLTQFK